MPNDMRDYRDYQKRKLSESTDGRGIKVAASSSPGTLVHTALSSVAANEWDEIFIQAVNTSATPVKLTVEWGGTDSPDDLIEVTIPAESGFTEVTPGHVLQNGALVRAFAAAANAIVLHGYVNRYQHI
ncbi:MAG: hypothetical protein OXG39_18290 [Chloroflexi bacterium]|nr:hypothetical protein [Chloroflexota bacterium]